MHRALLALVLLAGPATAFKPQAKQAPPLPLKKLASNLAAGVLGISTLVPAAFAGDSLVIDTPLEDRLQEFGAASYSVFNAISDVSPLADSIVSFVDAKVKGPDAADVVDKAVDGLLAIPDAKVSEYAGILKQVVYKGVDKDSCVTLAGSDAFRDKLLGSAAVKSLDKGKYDKLEAKFKPANSNVPKGKNGICLPGSAEASEKLWVAQAELTFSMPKTEASALVAAVKKAGASANRPNIATLVPGAENVFSKSKEALAMVQAGKNAEKQVISTYNAALK